LRLPGEIRASVGSPPLIGNAGLISIENVEFTASQDTNRMDAREDEFRVLMEQARAGSQDAMCELVERYAPHIVRAVRRKLSNAIRAKFDSVDFVQAVWASFFATPRGFVGFDRPEELMGYLVTLAHNKVVDEIRRRMKTEKYNVNRERSLDDSDLHVGRSLAGLEPSPSEVAVADELWKRLLKGLPEHYRRILELRREGNTQQQIADELGLNEKTVRRAIQRIYDEQMP
jgi:RNA polymerase sigma-70 factor (ECF subfamily)